MEPKNRKKGFAMLEVMIIIMVFMVLAASLFASAGAINRRAVSRAANNEAYYAALAAVKLMAGEVMNHNNEVGSAANDLLNNLPKTDSEIDFSRTGDDGYPIDRNVPVTVSSALKTIKGIRYLTLTAEATVGGQTENVSITLQERQAYVPDYPYGCGVMGYLSLGTGSTFSGGPDVDLYLKGLEAAGGDLEAIEAVGGNLIVDGKSSENGIKIQLKGTEIGGMIISNDNVSLERCVVGNSSNKNSGRRGGIYTLGNVSLTNCDIYGDVYANEFTGNGEEKITGSLNYVIWNRNNYTVWDYAKQAYNTADDEYRRNGEINAEEEKRKILNATKLTDYVPKEEDIFVPQTGGVSEKEGMKIVTIKDNEDKSLDEVFEELSLSESEGEGQPIKCVIMMEEGGILHIPTGTWNVYVYGDGVVSIGGSSKGTDANIYGGIQAKKIEVMDGTNLHMYHGEPAGKSFKTPSSAIGFKEWTPLDYNMNPSSKESADEEEK